MLKGTGLVKPIDSMGRLILPKEIRRHLEVDSGKDHVEFFLDDNSIVIKKYKPACFFCNELDNLVYYKDKRVCKWCIDRLQSLKEETPDDTED